MVPKNVKESKDLLKIKKAEAMQNNIDGNKKTVLKVAEKN